MDEQQKQQVEELVKYAQDNDVTLDDEVHDMKGQEAADINNEGVNSQIKYLLGCRYTPDDIRELIDACIE